MAVHDMLLSRLALLRQSMPLSVLQNAQRTVTTGYREAARVGALKKDPIQSMQQAIAYALYRMPATVTVLEHCLSQISSLPNDASIIDFGSGTGAGVWALLPLVTQGHYHLIERNSFMRDVAQQILPDVKKISWHSSLLALSETDMADLVLASYVLSELSAKDVFATIEKMWSHTKQYLVIVDSGTPFAYQRLMAVRSALIDQGAFIIAPCGHQKACPVLDNADDWCHFSLNVSRPSFHQAVKRGTLNWESEKYSYLIAARASYHIAGQRIIKKPRKASGMVMLDLCTKDGIKHQTITKKNQPLYKQAKKVSWGDLFAGMNED